MPWDSQSIRKHNKSLKGAAAGKTARQANAILRSGASEGVALATAFKAANKRKHKSDNPGHINKLRKSGNISNKAAAKLEDTYGKFDGENADASSA
jgi:hypothetical protein